MAKKKVKVPVYEVEYKYNSTKKVGKKVMPTTIKGKELIFHSGKDLFGKKVGKKVKDVIVDVYYDGRAIKTFTNKHINLIADALRYGYSCTDANKADIKFLNINKNTDPTKRLSKKDWLTLKEKMKDNMKFYKK